VRVLVISDLHANDTAFKAVLADAGAVDQTWCLGDIVGYGPDPNQVVERVRGLPNLRCVFGNHDAALIHRMQLDVFNGDARASLNWAGAVLSEDNANFLRSLPPLDRIDGIATLAHGSPRDPTWEYVLTSLAARSNFSHFETPFCFVGHSHVQCVFELDEVENRVVASPNRIAEAVSLPRRTIANPGSVGQPRDRDPRAAYAIFDPEHRTWETRRVDYDIAMVQKRILDAGLPARHALRLAEGW